MIPSLREFAKQLILLVILSLAWAGIALASPPGRISFKAYGAEQGLSNSSPWALAQDGQGFIWVGTEGGLYRFDGQRFQAFGLKDGLPSVFVKALHVDEEGLLWVGTYKGLSCLREGRFQAAALPQAQVNAISSGPDGQVWVGMTEGLFRRLPDGRFQGVPGWPGGAVTALWSRPGSEAVWVASWLDSRATVLRWDAKGWRPCEGGKAFTQERIDALAVDGRGSVWARSLDHLWCLNAGKGVFEHSKPTLPSARQKGNLYVDPRGRLWVTTDQGLFLNTGGKWTRMGLAEGLPRTTLLSILEDREGSLWIAGEGLCRLLGGGVLRSYTETEGLPNDAVWCIFRDKAGALFLGTDDGLAQAQERGWKAVPGTRNFQVRSIVQGPDGALYLGGGPQILRLDPKGSIRRFGSAEGIATSGRIFRLLFDRQGNLWVATDGGGLLKGQGLGNQWRFRRQDIPGGTSTERFSDLFQDVSGRLWATGERGLAMWDGNAWRRFTVQDGLRSDHISHIRANGKGELLISYFDPYGLCRAAYTQGAFRVLGHMDQIFPQGQQVYLYEEDPRGNLWVGTGQGLDMVSPEGRVEHFGRGEGLVGEDTNAMAILPEANGDVWIGTSSGLARFDAGSYKGVPKPPGTVFLECRLGTQEYASSPSSDVVRIPHGASTFVVKFAGLSYIREGKVQYQVRLEGLEHDWHFSETREERYPALSPGKYRFDARSRVGQGEWGPISSFAFQVLPAWWQTWWFRALMLLGGAGALALVIRWRVDALHRRNHALEGMVAARTHEVEAKAKELEQANEALRNQSLTDPLTGLRNRRYLGVCMPKDVAQVQRVHRDVVATRTNRVLLNIDLVFLMVDIDHFKFVNDHYGHAAGDQVLQQVAEILRQVTRDSDTVVRWGGEEFLVVARNAARRESVILAERIRKQMAEHDFLLEDGTTLHRTCSVGFTFYPFVPENPNFLPWEQVLDIADHCLFAAKRGGRDAWVGLFPRDGCDTTRLQAGLPMDIPGLLGCGEVTVATSLPDTCGLDWDLRT